MISAPVKGEASGRHRVPDARLAGSRRRSPYNRIVVQSLSARFIGRLKARDPEAWFELWEIFGPVLRAQFSRWGRGRIGAETVRDLSQETLAALSDSIDRHDPARGARFSTWLLSIARHVLGDEIDRRMAQKRGSGRRTASLDESWAGVDSSPRPDRNYEEAVFRAKVAASIRRVEREADFVDFSIYRMRVFDGMSGKDVAEHLGMSEPTVSRRLAKIRERLKERLHEVIATYSFTRDEMDEAARKGLDLNPNKSDDALFDGALAEIYLTEVQLPRAAGEPGAP